MKHIVHHICRIQYLYQTPQRMINPYHHVMFHHPQTADTYVESSLDVHFHRLIDPHLTDMVRYTYVKSGLGVQLY